MKNKVRKAKLEDLGELLSLGYQLSPLKKYQSVEEKKLLKILLKILRDKNYRLCVYECDGKIIGAATLLIQLNLSHNGQPYGHIENVVTDKSCRGRGVGKKMIEYLIDQARKRNCYKVILDCAKHNIPFYRRCKMKETSEVEMRIDL